MCVFVCEVGAGGGGGGGGSLRLTEKFGNFLKGYIF